MKEINGKEYRNIQEQVQKNMEDIKELQEQIKELILKLMELDKWI